MNNIAKELLTSMHCDNCGVVTLMGVTQEERARIESAGQFIACTECDRILKLKEKSLDERLHVQAKIDIELARIDTLREEQKLVEREIEVCDKKLQQVKRVRDRFHLQAANHGGLQLN